MYNVSSKFNTFYKDYVVLPATEQTNLREKKDLNIERLEAGLKEYNTENKTSYTLIDHKVQGSMAMSTIVQNESSEYDIDVAIIFDKALFQNLGTTATKNIIVDALKRKTKTFKTEPEALTNAVRVEYSDGYHIDFAVYRRSVDVWGKYVYEHCGSDWRNRDPEAITNWFNTANSKVDDNIRKVVRLLKMFCKSRSGWAMPGGLIQSVLVEECIQSKDRVDETFYYTIKEIRDRLENNKEVYNPMDTSTSLLLNIKDHQKVKNLHTRLKSYINKMAVLFESTCTEQKAISAWKEFFNHTYWGELVSETASRSMVAKSFGYNSVSISAEVQWVHSVRFPLTDFNKPLPKGKAVHFKANPNFHQYSSIKWEVTNAGDEAIDDNNVSFTHDGATFSPSTKYRGIHRIKCSVYNSVGGEICNNEVFVRVK